MTKPDDSDYYLQRKSVFKESFVYAIFVDFPDRTYVKIGRTTDVAPRAYALQIGCPFPVRSIYACDVVERAESARKERLLHKHYRGSHFRGEWFAPFIGVATPGELAAFESDMLTMVSMSLPGSIFSYRWTPKNDCGKNVRLVKVQVTPEETKNLPYFAIKDPRARIKAMREIGIDDSGQYSVPLSMRKGRRYRKC